LQHPDGRSWKNDNLTIRLTKGEDILLQKHLSDTVYKASEGNFAMLQNGNTNFAIRHTNSLLYTHPFQEKILDFSWYLYPTDSIEVFYICNNYNGGSIVGYDADKDQLVMVPALDPKVVKWKVVLMEDPKNKMKALAFASQGQGKVNAEEDYQQVSKCVYPREIQKMLNFEESTCKLQKPVSNVVTNSNFRPSTPGLFVKDPTLAEGVYPSGCAIDYGEVGTFKTGMLDVASNINALNMIVLQKLRNQVLSLNNEIVNLQNVVIPGQVKTLDKTIAKYNEWKDYCVATSNMVHWAQVSELPRQVALIASNNNIVQGKENELRELNGKVETSEEKCDRKTYVDWKRLKPPKTLATLSASEGMLCGTTSSGEIWCLPPSKKEWKQVPGTLRQVNIDGKRACGTQVNKDIYCTDDVLNPSWQHINGKLYHIDVSGDTMCGVQSGPNYLDQTIWCANFKKDNWQKIDGWLKQMSIDGTKACGVSYDDRIWCKDNIYTSQWNNIYGSLQNIDVRGNKMCGVNWNRDSYCADFNKPNWRYIPGKQNQLTIDKDTMYSINDKSDLMYQKTPS